jgi:hypothetical protein
VTRTTSVDLEARRGKCDEPQTGSGVQQTRSNQAWQTVKAVRNREGGT